MNNVVKLNLNEVALVVGGKGKKVPPKKPTLTPVCKSGGCGWGDTVWSYGTSALITAGSLILLNSFETTGNPVKKFLSGSEETEGLINYGNRWVGGGMLVAGIASFVYRNFIR